MKDADPMQLRQLAAEAVAREAGALARRRFLDASFKVGFKGPQDYLTEVDGETEELISSRLNEAFPRGRLHRRGDGGAVGAGSRSDVGRRPDRRDVELRPRRVAFLRFDRLRRGTAGSRSA